MLGERVGSAVWLAEDTRTGKRVALKLLTRQLPQDQTRRDALVREVRIAAALYHTFLVPILEIAPVDDNLLMVMDVIDGQPLSRKIGGQPLGSAEFFRIAYQLASAVKYLHVKGLLHGNINGDSVIITPAGEVKLGGVNLANLMRHDNRSSAYQQKGSDRRTVAFLAPEQIASHTMDEKTDVFSMGVVMYEMATGKLPFTGATAADVAHEIVEGQPPSPKSVNPQIDGAVMNFLGGCLFRDPYKRHRDAKALVELIERVDGQAVGFAAQFDRKVASSPLAGESDERRTILFVADVAGYQALAEKDPESAARAAARMQQLLGESVYLFGGEVVDPFGSRMVASLPSVDTALEAGRKAEFDLSSPGDAEPIPPVRMLLHAGDVEMRDGTFHGAAVEKAFETLALLPPGALLISEDFVKEGRGNARLRDAGARGGVKLYTIVPPEPEIEASDPTPETAELQAELEAEAEALKVVAAAERTKRRIFASAAAMVVVALLGGAASMWLRNGATESSGVDIASAQVPPPASATNPRSVYIAPFRVESQDATVAERAKATRLGVMAVLRSFPELRIVDAPSEGVVRVSATFQGESADAQMVATAGDNSSAPVAAVDPASGIRAIVQLVIASARAEPRTYAAADALNAFANAIVARSRDDAAGADASLQAALASDPKFLAAHVAAMELHASRGDEKGALAAARQIVQLDPRNLEATRKVARASLITGDLRQALALYDVLLDGAPDDAEALNHLARYALAAGDTATFEATLARLRRLPPVAVMAHEPDVLAFAGRLDAAMQRYYAAEEAAPSSPSLALKVGRLAVLRHSLPIAELELAKLSRLDPLYGHHLLAAYIAAERKQRDVAKRELAAALTVAVPGDDSWTAAAEVHAIMADDAGVIESLEKAARRKEPTAAYVLRNPLFEYLRNDSRFQLVSAKLIAQQEEIRTALAAIR